MVNRVLLRKLARDVARRKTALAALAIIVAVGITSYVGMAGVYLDLDNSRAAYYREYRLADFTVDLKRAPAWLADHVEGLPNVREARGRVSMAVSIELENVPEPISGHAISMPPRPFPVINDILLRSGTWFSGSDAGEVIVNEAFARENGLVPGSRIKVLLLDKQHELLVVGTAMSPEFVYILPLGGGIAPDPKMFGVLYLEQAFLQKSADLDGAWNQLVCKAHDNSPTAVANTLDLLERKLDPYGVTNTTPAEDQPSVRFLSEELKGLRVGARIMPAVFLAVAALVLNVLISRMVAQQRTTIGVMRAVGYTRGDVLKHYLAYGAVVGIAGGILGLILGGWMQRGMVAMYRPFFALPSIEAHFYPGLVLTAFSVGVAFALAGAFRGALRAIRMEPADAMRPPPPEIGARVLPERIGFFWRRLPFRWRMIIRAIFRNPFRSSVNVLACAVSAALLFAMLHNYDAFLFLVDHEYERMARQDFTIALRDPADSGAVGEAAGFGGVGSVEPELLVACDLSNGPFEKRVAVTGMAPGNSLHTPVDRDGRPIGVPDAGLLLTRKLADILHVGAGDTVRMRALIGHRREVNVPVVSVVDTYLGLSAYADISYLARLIGEELVANALLGSFRGSASGDFLEQVKERPSVIGLGERTRAIELIDEAIGASLAPSIIIIMLFAGAIAVGSMLNTALVSLSEREREVGSLRVMGYTPPQILQLFAGESFLLNALGIAAGLLLGIGLAHLLSRAYYTEIYRFPVVIRARQFVLAGSSMLVFFALAQSLVYRIILSLDWLEVLKSKE